MELGCDAIQQSHFIMFFYWNGADNPSLCQYGNFIILTFIILADYFQISIQKTDDLIKILKEFNLNEVYHTMKSFFTIKHIPWHLFKEILKNEFVAKTLKFPWNSYLKKMIFLLSVNLNFNPFFWVSILQFPKTCFT